MADRNEDEHDTDDGASSGIKTPRVLYIKEARMRSWEYGLAQLMKAAQEIDDGIQRLVASQSAPTPHNRRQSPQQTRHTPSRHKEVKNSNFMPKNFIVQDFPQQPLQQHHHPRHEEKKNQKKFDFEVASSKRIHNQHLLDFEKVHLTRAPYGQSKQDVLDQEKECTTKPLQASTNPEPNHGEVQSEEAPSRNMHVSNFAEEKSSRTPTGRNLQGVVCDQEKVNLSKLHQDRHQGRLEDKVDQEERRKEQQSLVVSRTQEEYILLTLHPLMVLIFQVHTEVKDSVVHLYKIQSLSKYSSNLFKPCLKGFPSMQSGDSMCLVPQGYFYDRNNQGSEVEGLPIQCFGEFPSHLAKPMRYSCFPSMIDFKKSILLPIDIMDVDRRIPRITSGWIMHLKLELLQKPNYATYDGILSSLKLIQEYGLYFNPKEGDLKVAHGKELFNYFDVLKGSTKLLSNFHDPDLRTNPFQEGEYDEPQIWAEIFHHHKKEPFDPSKEEAPFKVPNSAIWAYLSQDGSSGDEGSLIEPNPTNWDQVGLTSKITHDIQEDQRPFKLFGPKVKINRMEDEIKLVQDFNHTLDQASSPIKKKSTRSFYWAKEYG